MDYSTNPSGEDGAQPVAGAVPTLTRKGVTYTECLVPACRYIHLVVDGRAWAEWTHPAAVISPWVRRALRGELPAKVTR